MPFKNGPEVPIPEELTKDIFLNRRESDSDVWPTFRPIISRWFQHESDAREANSFDHV